MIDIRVHLWYCMTMTQRLANLTDCLSRRRIQLGMSHSSLAKRSGVSEPTVKRILGGRIAEASFANVFAVANSLGMPVTLLGMPVTLKSMGVDEVREKQARAKAVRIARMVQGTSGLEGQAVDDDQYQRLVEQSFYELLAGSNRRLWSA